MSESEGSQQASYIATDNDDSRGSDYDASETEQCSSSDTVMFEKHMALFQETNIVLLAILEKAKRESDKLRSRAGEVMEVINGMVAEGLLEEAGTMWCFMVTTLVDRDLASMFLCIKNNNARLAWMTYRYNLKKGIP